MNIGIIGYGYWGPNVVRCFNLIEGVEIVSVCDLNPDALKRVSKLYPAISTTNDSNSILCSPEIDAVAIVSPVSTHFELSKKALENGKHIFVEKPFTSSVAEARELIDIAAKKNLKIMVDHTFLFTGAVKKIKELLDEDVLGELYYYDSTRINLGLFQHDVNVIWDLAPHDFSIMGHIIKEKPVALTATGIDHFNRDLENIAYVTVFFQSSMVAHFNVNWLSPVKIRKTLIGGEKKMLVWDDLLADEKIKIYDKGVSIEDKEGTYKAMAAYRHGDMWSPRLELTEALQIETKYFVDCINNDLTPINDGEAGLDVIKLLEASSKSLKMKGALVKL